MSPTRDELALQYIDQLPYTPYPVQEEALFAWFSSEQGVLVCAPTGTGKTLIAQAALFEALHTGAVAYYTTPLIALTEQKFHEMQASAVRWGFKEDDVGLVTGNRRVNPGLRLGHRLFGDRQATAEARQFVRRLRDARSTDHLVGSHWRPLVEELLVTAVHGRG